MNGQKKFTLAVAYLAKGKKDVVVSSENVKKLWNKNKGLFGGGYLTMYGTRAKDNEYLDSNKPKNYTLTKKWENIFQ